MITETFFVPLARRTSIPGVLVDIVQYGIFKITWQVSLLLLCLRQTIIFVFQKYEFIIYIVTVRIHVLSDNATFLIFLPSILLAWEIRYCILSFTKVSRWFLYARYDLIVCIGPEEDSRLFLSSVGAWATALHDEIWVFNKGFWSKSHSLWKEVQKANWKDVILKDEFKEALQKDIYGFFNSKAIYKELVIPWKVCPLPRFPRRRLTPSSVVS